MNHPSPGVPAAGVPATHDPLPGDGYDPALAQELEAAPPAGDVPPPAGYLWAPLSGVPDGAPHDAPSETRQVLVLAPGRWRASALRALNQGDFDGFMLSVLHESSQDDYWELDITQEQFNDFCQAAAEAGQEPLGKSSGRRTSSRGSRKR